VKTAQCLPYLPQAGILEFEIRNPCLGVPFGQRDAAMRYILFGNFVEEDVNSVFWNLKRIGNSMGDVLNEFLLLLRSSPWKQTDLNDGHLFLLSLNRVQGFEGSRVPVFFLIISLEPLNPFSRFKYFPPRFFPSTKFF
jgi:hypothetical protein